MITLALTTLCIALPAANNSGDMVPYQSLVNRPLNGGAYYAWEEGCQTSGDCCAPGGSICFVEYPDFDGDGDVDMAEMIIVMNAWGQDPSASLQFLKADLNGDGSINGLDITMLMGQWGPVAPF